MDDVDKRLTELEIKATYTEDLLDHLQAQVVEQQRLIERLARELVALRERLPEGGPSLSRDLGDERPPHY